ncbi:hypothetical protein Patl1_19734 [Pistacia atlantica]|uniref:Uncharacterized protein n=1 Tax=Pistacia atlantica TaxID=434234 RepID=A0ACC1C257_9ROSI|nr:hypothetical protein Patl1_19734 [Pistacia atlantica]
MPLLQVCTSLDGGTGSSSARRLPLEPDASNDDSDPEFGSTLSQLSQMVSDREFGSNLSQMASQFGSTFENMDDWRRKLTMLLDNKDEQEIVSREKKDRRDFQQLSALATGMGLHSRQYEKVVVFSKVTLPSYRSDLDDKRPPREVILPLELLREVDSHLKAYEQLKYRNGGFLSDNSLSESNSSGSIATDEGLYEQQVPLVRNSALMEKMLWWRSLPLREKQRYWQETPEGQKMLEFRRSLPAHKEREALLNAIAQNQVVVVSGETGCGKTTQLPQYILESEIEAARGLACSIICTQPRRISAIAVSERVAAERGEKIGESVGYKVRLEGIKGRDTRLLFCTTGILLRRLLVDRNLKGVTHVIVDEIHERGMNEDFLLIVLKDLLPQRPELRLILMSATLNAELFSSYFDGAPMLHIPGFTYPVEEHFLEQILERTGYQLTSYNQIDDYGQEKSWKMQKQAQALRKKKSQIASAVEDVLEAADFKDYSLRTRESLFCWNPDSVGFNLIEHVLCHITKNERPGAVLVFMTGWDDINSLKDQLQRHPLLGDPGRVLLLACHGSMDSSEQRLIFDKPEDGVRKIVLATNMAETSITINDAVFVVDCGKAKEASYDALNNTPCLLNILDFKGFCPTTVHCLQKGSVLTSFNEYCEFKCYQFYNVVTVWQDNHRRGRAGRVQPGECYHLYPRCVYDAFADYQLPELLRTPLHSLCLQIKSLQLGSISEFLSRALQPPEPLSVKNAIDYLKIIGALDENENLTVLGRNMAMLPVEPKLGKMLILGAIFNCLDPIMTVVAGLSFRDPFLMPLAESAKGQFSARDYSDHLALVRAYDGWKDAERRQYDYEYCRKNFLSAQTLKAIDSLRVQFLYLLKDTGLVEHNTENCNKWSHDEHLVRAVICAGLFPGICSVMNKEKSIALKTMDDGQVLLYSNSVNAGVPKIPYPWLVFNQKVKVNAVFLRDSTGISDSVLLMFGGSISSGGPDGHLKMLGGYLEFSMEPALADMYLSLKQEINELIQKKLLNPEMDMQVHNELLMAVRLLVSKDKCEGRFVDDHQVPEPSQKEAKVTLPVPGMVSEGGGDNSKTELQTLGMVSKGGDDNSKTELQTLAVKAGQEVPTYETNELKGNQFLSTVIVNGSDFFGQPCSSKEDAENDAAAAALLWLKGFNSWR